MAHIAFIECNNSGSGFRAVRRARELGLRTTFVTRDPGYYRSSGQHLSHLLDQCDHLLVTDTNDVAGLIHTLARHSANDPLHGLACFGEYYVHVTSIAARALGLPGPAPEAVGAARDKSRTRRLLSESGLPVPRFAVVDSPVDVPMIADVVGFPCVVKPVDRSSSTHVRLARDVEELAEHVQLINGCSRHARGFPLSTVALVESYLDGAEYSVETLAFRGDVRVLGVTSKGLVGDGTFTEIEHILPAPGLDEADRHDVVEAALAALRLIGYDHGPAHTEVKLTSHGPVVIEVNARTGGDPIPELVRIATGFDLTAAVLLAAVGVSPDWQQVSLAGAAGVRYVTAERDGTLVGVHGIDQLRGDPDVVETGMLAAPGSTVHRPTSNNDLLAYAIVRGSSPEAVSERLSDIADHVHLVIADPKTGDGTPAARTFESVTGTIGDTPLVRLNRLVPPGGAAVWVKLEGFNPGGSVKDRPARNMIQRARARGDLPENGTVVEASSGNLGAALSMIGAAEGHPVRIMIDPRTSTSNAAMIKAFGAQLEVVTQADANGKYQIPRIRRAQTIANMTPDAFLPDQWGNPDNPAAHERGTAREIIAELDGQIAAVVCTTSSCGQVTGIGRAMRRAVPGCLVIAVDGVGSMALGGPRGHHKLTGIGSGFTPDNLDLSVVDDVYWCHDEDAFATCRLLARTEGLLVGGSSGAAVLLAIRAAAELTPADNVVAICPDGGEKYLDTIYDDNWLADNGFAAVLATEPARLWQAAASYTPTPGADIKPYRPIEP